MPCSFPGGIQLNFGEGRFSFLVILQLRGALMGRNEMRTKLIGNPEELNMLRRTRRKFEDNIKMDLKEVGCQYMEWIHLTKDSVQGRVPCEPSSEILCFI
jgi:hypothetical protein